MRNKNTQTGISRRAYLLLKSAELLLERADSLEDYLAQGDGLEVVNVALFKRDISRLHYAVAEMASRIPPTLKDRVLKRELELLNENEPV